MDAKATKLVHKHLGKAMMVERENCLSVIDRVVRLANRKYKANSRPRKVALKWLELAKELIAKEAVP